MIEKLFSSWLEFSLAVSAMRTHLMVIDENEGILPYKTWFMHSNVCLSQACMQMLAAGRAGAIYAPELFSSDYLDDKLFTKLCPDADDLWLKLIEVMFGVLVVPARPNRALRYVPGSQKTGLRYSNLENGRK